MLIRQIILISISLFILGCQSAHVVKLPNPEQLYLDHQFLGYENIPIVSIEDIFQIDDTMKNIVASQIIGENNREAQAHALVSFIFDNNSGDVLYDMSANLTAKQSFYHKRANCLSLTILAYVLANEAGIDAHFQRVYIPEYWYRQGNYNMRAGHVNLVIKAKQQALSRVIYGNNDIVIDFDPYSIRKHFKSKIIGKNTIAAMYYNNLAGKAIVDKQYTKAFALLRRATGLDPYYESAWANLGVIYRHKNQINDAERVYRHALKINPNDMTVLDNLALLLRQTGREGQANTIEKRLAKKRSDNPYYYALMANEAYYSQHYEQAVIAYKKAISMNKREHEFYFGLAKAYFKLDKTELAAESMKKAIKHNDFKQLDNKYAAKLSFLQQI